MRACVIEAVCCQAGLAEVRSIVELVAAAGVVEVRLAAPPLYRTFPGRYMTDDPLTTPLAPPTWVQVLALGLSSNDASSDGPIVNTLPFGMRYENGYSSS